MNAAVRELVSEVTDPRLRAELAVDLRACGSPFDAQSLLPSWTARSLWRAAEAEHLPMEYVVRVTELPRSIDAPLDTAALVVDFRRTSMAHRDCAAALAIYACVDDDAAARPPSAERIELDAHREAARRWRALAQRVLLGK
jgi:hypothetical protein